MEQRIQTLLESVGLDDKANKRPGELSHGERQRVAVCRAMLNHPQLLLADEPTGNLDQVNKQNVVELLIRQAKEHDSMLLMVTHDHSMLESFERVIDFSAIGQPFSQKPGHRAGNKSHEGRLVSGLALSALSSIQVNRVAGFCDIDDVSAGNHTSAGSGQRHGPHRQGAVYTAIAGRTWRGPGTGS